MALRMPNDQIIIEELANLCSQYGLKPYVLKAESMIWEVRFIAKSVDLYVGLDYNYPRLWALFRRPKGRGSFDPPESDAEYRQLSSDKVALDVIVYRRAPTKRDAETLKSLLLKRVNVSKERSVRSQAELVAACLQDYAADFLSGNTSAFDEFPAPYGEIERPRED